MLSRIISVQDEITELVHDRELKALVAAMKQEAKSKFSEILDTVQSKEFWRTAKCLVELSAPAMKGLGIQTNSRCSLGIMKMFSRLTVCVQRAMSAQAQEQALVIRALPECNGVTQWAPCPRRAGVAVMAWAGSFSGS